MFTKSTISINKARKIIIFIIKFKIHLKHITYLDVLYYTNLKISIYAYCIHKLISREYFIFSCLENRTLIARTQLKSRWKIPRKSAIVKCFFFLYVELDVFFLLFSQPFELVHAHTLIDSKQQKEKLHIYASSHKYVDIVLVHNIHTHIYYTSSIQQSWTKNSKLTLIYRKIRCVSSKLSV